MKISLLPIGFLTIVIAACVIVLVKQNKPPLHLFGTIPDQITPSYFENRLDWMDSQNFNHEDYGSSSKLIHFTTASGKAIELLIAEGEFSNKGIKPLEAWKSTLNDQTSVLVNSVDQNYNCYRGINEFVCNGCEFSEKSKSIKSIGNTEIVECDGTYSTNLNIDYVCQMVVVNFANRVGERLYFKEFKTIQDEWGNNLVEALNNFWANWHLNFNHSEHISNIIIPEIGTGIGGLDKAEFYRLYFESLSEAIENESFKVWPDQIIIQVWRDDIDVDGQNSKNYIADEIFTFYQQLKIESASNKVDSTYLYRIIGISVFLILAIIVYQSYCPGILSKMKIDNVFLSSLGALLLSIGTLDLFQKLIPPLDYQNFPNYVNILIGIAVVPISILLLRAKDATPQ